MISRTFWTSVALAALVGASASCDGKSKKSDARGDDDDGGSGQESGETTGGGTTTGGETTGGGTTGGTTTGGTTTGGGTTGGTTTGGTTTGGTTTGGGGDVDAKYKQTIDPTSTASVQKGLTEPFCAPCHSGAHPAHGLDLSDLEKVVQEAYDDGPGRDDAANDDDHHHHGRVIEPGEPSLSTLYRVLLTPAPTDVKAMPPAGNPLGIPHPSADQVKAVEAWIKQLPPRNDEPDGSDDDDGNGNDNNDDGDGFTR